MFYSKARSTKTKVAVASLLAAFALLLLAAMPAEAQAATNVVTMKEGVYSTFKNASTQGKIVVSKPGVIILRVKSCSATTDVQFQLYDSKGNIICNSLDTEGYKSYEQTNVPVSKGTYYLKARRCHGSCKVKYTFKGNDAAKTMKEGKYYMLTGPSSQGKVVVSGPGLLTYTAKCYTYNGSFKIGLYDARGKLVGNEYINPNIVDSSGYESSTVAVHAKGTYYLRTSYFSTYKESYISRPKLSGKVQWEFTPFNTVSMQKGKTYKVEDEEDQYKIIVPTSGVITISGKAVEDGANFTLNLYDARGNHIGNVLYVNDGDFWRKTKIRVTKGTYYLRTEGFDYGYDYGAKIKWTFKQS